MDADSLHVARSWADVAFMVWRDVRGEVLSAALGLLVGWLGLKRPRLRKFTRAGDKIGGKNGGR